MSKQTEVARVQIIFKILLLSNYLTNSLLVLILNKKVSILVFTSLSCAGSSSNCSLIDFPRIDRFVN